MYLVDPVIEALLLIDGAFNVFNEFRLNFHVLLRVLL